jgi:hypothetical protein
MEKCTPIDLQGWVPAANWVDEILYQKIADDGEAQTLETFAVPANADGTDIAAQIEDFVRQSRKGQKFVFPEGLPASMVILACLKHCSPLPPEFWRLSIFEAAQSQQESPPKV